MCGRGTRGSVSERHGGTSRAQDGPCARTRSDREDPHGIPARDEIAELEGLRLGSLRNLQCAVPHRNDVCELAVFVDDGKVAALNLRHEIQAVFKLSFGIDRNDIVSHDHLDLGFL